MTYLMNIHTGTIDTKENWESEYQEAVNANEVCERGFDKDPWDADLIEVKEDESGEWVEV